MLIDREAKERLEGFRLRLHEIIFEADTPAGKAFDVGLIICIIASVIVVMLDSVPSIQKDYGHILTALEWIFTAVFTVEYVLRVYCIGKPLKYVLSFYGIIDLLAVIPTYLGIFIPGGQAKFLLTVRILRVSRIFRVLKLAACIGEADLLIQALRDSRRKIIVFILSIVSVVVVLGAVMHIVEGPEHGFDSIPHSVYWAIVTMTTVGYGDISPQAPLGRGIASIVMLIGYSIIAIPTGIVTAEAVLKMRTKEDLNTQSCPECSAEGHDADAKHCKHCGAKL